MNVNGGMQYKSYMFLELFKSWGYDIILLSLYDIISLDNKQKSAYSGANLSLPI